MKRISPRLAIFMLASAFTTAPTTALAEPVVPYLDALFGGEGTQRPRLKLGILGQAVSTEVAVWLTPASGVSGRQRVNFAVPLSMGELTDAARVRVELEGQELPAARRGLARYPDQSLRSVQVQVEIDIQGATELIVKLGAAPRTGNLPLVPVSATLANESGTQGPRVWAQLQPERLTDSGVAGPLLTDEDVAGTPLAVWTQKCAYDVHDTESFLQKQSDGAVWLYDRGTVMYRGHAKSGDLSTLRSAYRETAIYRNGISGQGASIRIPVPSKAGDIKYHYTQNLAIHYLLTGDDRFRESAEQVASALGPIWTNDFWTERHAAFKLLGLTWAMIVSDDKAGTFRALADDAVKSFVAVQEKAPASDPAARCFANRGEETLGCSPWMSAILVDGLDQYATERGGAEAERARTAIVKVGRMMARHGRDGRGEPYYWLGVGGSKSQSDGYDEHWGESAYVIGMAWHHDGRTDATMRKAADELVAGFAKHGVAPHMRSFNWQCRSAVAAPYFLLE